MKLRH